MSLFCFFSKSHYSSFLNKSKKFNLALLINEEIKSALADNTVEDRQHYYNILTKLMYVYGIENEDVSFLTTKSNKLINQIRMEAIDVQDSSRSRNKSTAEYSSHSNNTETDNNVNDDSGSTSGDIKDENSCCRIM